jgi:hypothetical protein
MKGLWVKNDIGAIELNWQEWCRKFHDTVYGTHCSKQDEANVMANRYLASLLTSKSDQ